MLPPLPRLFERIFFCTVTATAARQPLVCCRWARWVRGARGPASRFSPTVPLPVILPQQGFGWDEQRHRAATESSARYTTPPLTDCLTFRQFAVGRSHCAGQRS